MKGNINFTSLYLTDAVAKNKPNAKAKTSPYPITKGRKTTCQGGTPLMKKYKVRKITKAITKSIRQTSRPDKGNKIFGK
jgi:hypothetical protein